MLSVTAKPLTAPVPTYIRIKDVSKVVMLESNTAEKARSYPISTAVRSLWPFSSSSRMRSKTSTLASTAMPMVRMIPAMPGKVSVQLNAAIAPIINITLSHSAVTAIKPMAR